MPTRQIMGFFTVLPSTEGALVPRPEPESRFVQPVETNDKARSVTNKAKRKSIGEGEQVSGRAQVEGDLRTKGGDDLLAAWIDRGKL